MIRLRKRIFMVLMSCLICTVSIPVHNISVKASETTAGNEIVQSILELLVGLAVSYEIEINLPDELMDPRIPKDEIALDVMQLTEMEQAIIELCGPGYANWYYETEYNRIHYSDGSVYEGTNINGKDYFLNPYMVSMLVSANLWESVIKANNALKAMSITSMFGMSQALGQNNTDLQLKTNLAINQCMSLVATAMQGLKIATVTPVLVDYSTDLFIQRSRYNTFTINMKSIVDSGNYPYYLVEDHSWLAGRASIFFSSIPISKVSDGGDISRYNANGYLFQYYDGVWHDNGPLWTYFDHVDYAWELRYTNTALQVTNPYNITEFPYSYNVFDSQNNGEVPDVGVLENVVSGAISVGVSGIIDLTKEEIKDIFGTEIDGSYEKVQEVMLPQEYLDAEKVFQDGVLGWLQSLWSSIDSTSSTIVAGVSTSFAQAMTDVLVGEDEEGNKVYVPDVLGNIYGNLTDTSGILVGISDALNGVKEEIQSQSQARANENADAKALSDEMISQIPTGGGGLFQLITSLVLILLMLLYLFLRCLQFIVLLFQTPATTTFLTPGMIDGINWLKTTNLTGHADAKLTFDAVSQSNSIGLNISIWNFMMGTINFLIFFYIIKRLRGHVERMR